VLSVQNNSLCLEDGRVVLVHRVDARLDEMIEASDNRVDVELVDGTSRVTIFAKSELGYCGDPAAFFRAILPPYRIPLIPDDFPLNHREAVGTGRIVLNQRRSAVQDPR